MLRKKIVTLIIGTTLVTGLGIVPMAACAKTNTTKEYVTAIKVQAVKGHKELPAKKDVANNKTFEVQFNKEIDLSTVNKSNLKVTDRSGNTVPVTFKLKSGNNKMLIIEAPKEGYKSGESYTLNIYDGIKTRDNKKGLGHTITMKFTVKKDSSNTDPQYPTNIYNDAELASLVKLFVKHEYGKTNGEPYTKEEFKKLYLNDKANKVKFDNVLNMESYKRIKGCTIDFNKVPEIDSSYPYSRIYRTDLEKELMNDINNYRKEKGLNQLKYDPNLEAVAKYAVRYHHEVKPARDMFSSSINFNQFNLAPYNEYYGNCSSNSDDTQPAALVSMCMDHKGDSVARDKYIDEIKRTGQYKNILACKKYTKVGIGIIHFSEAFGSNRQGTYCVVMVDGEVQNE